MAPGKQAVIENKPFHKADMKETWADIGKADRLLDWRPEVPPFAGFERSVDWYNENRAWLARVIV